MNYREMSELDKLVSLLRSHTQTTADSTLSLHHSSNQVCTIRYDMIEELIVYSKAEYSASASTHRRKI